MIKKHQRICFQADGTLETGKRIIKALSLIGSNPSTYDGTAKYMFYFVSHNGTITHSYSIPEGYELLNLAPQETPFSENNPLIIIDGEEVSLSYLIETYKKYNQIKSITKQL